MIDVARIDYWAASGSGPLHRASALSKVIFLLLVVTASVMTRKPYPLAAGYAVLLLLVVLPDMIIYGCQAIQQEQVLLDFLPIHIPYK